MSKDHSERRTYRKSPGRQYGYDYDPLRNRNEQSQSGRIDSGGLREPGTTRGEMASKSGSLAAQRPDLRRTRQLLRQNIIATKARLVEEEGIEQEDFPEIEQPVQRVPEYSEYDEEEDTTLYRKRYPTRSGRLVQPRPARERVDPQEETWEDAGDIDPDQGYEEGGDLLDPRMRYSEEEPRYASRRPIRAYQEPIRRAGPVQEEDDYDEYEDDDYYEEEDRRAPVQRRGKNHKMSRRGLLIGAGLVAIGGAGAAAYELAPKLPQVVGTAAQNVEQQLQEAFQKGVTKGADDVRNEFINALEDMEGFTLSGAIAAARLTRVAYDVFVSPVVQFGSTLTGDFLNGMLKAVRTARGWLATVYMDNSSMIAVQKVLEAWVGKVGTMPKQLNAVVDTDLDGAQSYLNALQTKIKQEKAKLNNPQATPTPQPIKKAKK